jgi:hypothetical protein
MTNSIKHYLAQSVRTNGKWILIGWVGVLVFGLVLVLGRLLAPIQSIFSEHILSEFVVDIPLKAAFIILPIILFYRGETHKEWQEDNPPITKKEFSTAIYLEIFLSVFLGIAALIIVWIVAGLADPDIVERIFEVGVFSLGEGFLWVGLMTTLVYTLQFTPLVKIGQGSVLLAISLIGSLQVIILLQTPAWHFVNYVGISIPLLFAVYFLAALIVLFIGWAITAMLYKKIDL